MSKENLLATVNYDNTLNKHALKILVILRQSLFFLNKHYYDKIWASM